MYLLNIEIVNSTPIFIEHSNSAWIDVKYIDKYIRNEANNVKFLPADVNVFVKIKEYLSKKTK